MFHFPELSAPNTQWYAVHCRPLKEAQAARMIEERIGLAVYLPEIIRRFRRRVQRAPFFPGYLFVQADLQRVAMSSINALPGVLRLVSFSEMPTPVPASAIETIRLAVETLNNRGGLPEHGFLPGEHVRLKSGPLGGLDAVFVGPMKPSERVRVLIEFLGHLREAEVKVDILERNTAGLAPKRDRRTRGKGRFIRNH